MRTIEPLEQTDFVLEPVDARTPIEPATAASRSFRNARPRRIANRWRREASPADRAGAAAREDRETARVAPQPIQTRPQTQPRSKPPSDAGCDPSIPTEVIVINVLARNGAKFGGTDLLEAFLRNGLKFGDMNIFHRIQPASKEVQFSVASAVEPGTFDLSAMETFRTPGVSFFMRMPGPGQPLEVFEDMLAVTRDVAASLGADLKDEQLSVMTSQTIQHCRARIEDFSRKRMSQRA